MRATLGTRHVAAAFLVAVGLVAAWTALHGVPPAAVALVPCPLRAWSGIPCPGCGVTRASVALARAELAQAWALNPAAFLLVPLATLAALAPRSLRRGWGALPERARRLAVAAALAACLGAWGWRLAAGAAPQPDGAGAPRTTSIASP